MIPAIRKELAIAMKNNGLKQVEIAKRLGVTESAITQYIKNKRAGQINFNEKVKNQIKESVNLINNKIDTMREMQKILVLARSENTICELHRKLDKDFAECNVCFKHLIQVGKEHA